MAVTRPLLPNPERGWKMWHYDEIYRGPVEMPDDTSDIDLNRHVPNVGDWVVHEVSGFKRVSYVDPQTLIPDLRTITPINLESGVGEDMLVTPDPSLATTPYRLHVDASVLPIRFMPNSRVRTYHPDAAWFKIFRGTDITESGRVISTNVDINGVPNTTNLPLRLVAVPNSQNYSIKAPSSGYLIEPIADNSLVTMVFYSTDGQICDWRQLVTYNSPFVAPLDLSVRTISSIHLESPYLTEEDNRLIEYPINLALQSAGLMGVITYNDGQVARLPVDGTKFKLTGLDAYTANTVGQTMHAVLTYTMDRDEYAFGTTPEGSVRAITENYRLRTVEAEGAYTSKIYVIPEWAESTNRWVLKFYLTTMNRDEIHDITDLIEITPGYVFNGNRYGVAQTIRFAINLQSLGSTWSYYRQLGSVDITLSQPGTVRNAAGYYVVKYDADSTFGLNLKANRIRDTANASASALQLDNGCLTYEEWLQKFYYSISPLYYVHGESIPPHPTHVRLRLKRNNWVREVEITKILSLVSGVGFAIQQGETLYIEFIARTNEGDQELGITGIPVNILETAP